MRLSRRVSVIVVVGLVAFAVAAYLLGRVQPPEDVAVGFWEAILKGDGAAAMDLVYPYPNMPDAPRTERELLDEATLALRQAGLSRPKVSVVSAQSWKGLSAYVVIRLTEGDRSVVFRMRLDDSAGGWRGHWKLDVESCLRDLIANAQRRTSHSTGP